jgi:hypothetical protein
MSARRKRKRGNRPEFRNRAFKAKGEKCQWRGCQETDKAVLEIHHIVPVAQGGKDEIDNVKVYCKEHHFMAHGRAPISLLSFDGVNIEVGVSNEERQEQLIKANPKFAKILRGRSPKHIGQMVSEYRVNLTKKTPVKKVTKNAVTKTISVVDLANYITSLTEKGFTITA